MKGLLLAGGLGTRLRPLTYTGNKHTIPIANKPMILYAFDDLVKAGIKNIGVILGPLKEGIENILKDYPGVNITFIDQPDPKGLAHAVMTAEDFLDEPFVMHLGDNLLRDGISDFVKAFNETNADAVIGVTEVKDPRQYGVVVLEGGKVKKLIEKPKEPPSNLALVGVYVFSPIIHEYVKKLKPSWRGEYEITDAIQLMVNDGKRVEVVHVKGWWKDTGKPEDLLEANQLILDEISPNISGKVDGKIEGRVIIGEGTEVKDSRIRGPVIIGKNCKIYHAYIGPYTSIGDNCVINEVEIENSIIMNNVKIENIRVRISDNIIGNNVEIKRNEEMPKTFRFILGDNSKIDLV
ncbi:glucose-1-phosphate thymidylyltransferase [Acidianus manzaensis]|uniref:Glucose-1-phosphate thymidylyltransferase n=1 Tax=Acidianus manzaensis TaxID=282676 RepID=A0A1W6K351_9CREN|nr:glucose-1-phosphate thymidylyltransferase [Acidianus manzaensis]ARM76963.1 glucose-1-phosphate thymidylyltransferase [Acidianus manzaensis]